MGRSVQVPNRPSRIVAVSDAEGGIQILDLGVPLVGLATRNGTFERAMKVVPTPQSLAGVAPIGDVFSVSPEKVAALRPDLIVGGAFGGKLSTGLDKNLAQLEAIAPVAAIATFDPIPKVMARVAELVGRESDAEAEEKRFEARAADIRRRMASPPQGFTATSIYHFGNGQVRVNGPGVSALEAAITEVGVTFSPVTTASGQTFISYEQIGQLEADLVFHHFDPALPDSARALFDGLAAVQAGQAFEHDRTFTRTYSGLRRALDYLEPILTRPGLNPSVVS